MAAVKTRKSACLFCKIRKLKCVSSGKTLPNGEKDPCENCMIYKCHCALYKGVLDKNMIRQLDNNEYEELINQREQMTSSENFSKVSKELLALKSQIKQKISTNSSPDLTSSSLHSGIVNNNNSHESALFQSDFKQASLNIPFQYSTQSFDFVESDTSKRSKFFLPAGRNDSEYNAKVAALDGLKHKLKELEPILISALDNTGKSFSEFLKAQIENKSLELRQLKDQLAKSKSNNIWNVAEIQKATSKADYEKSTSMTTMLPVDVNSENAEYWDSKANKKRKIEKQNGEIGKADDMTIRSIENEFLRHSGYEELNLSELLIFNLDTKTGKIKSTPQLSYWDVVESKAQEPNLNYIPPLFGSYNPESFISKSGLELFLKKLLERNNNFEILPEREIKETLFLVLKFIQYYLSCANMTFDIYTEPFEYYGHNILPELSQVSKTSDKLLFLYSKLSSSLIETTLKQHPKFKEINKNIKKYVLDSTYAPFVLQFITVMTKVHQYTYRKNVLNYFAQKEQQSRIINHFDSIETLEFFETQDILLIMGIYFEEKSRYSSLECLDFIESMLLKFEMTVTFQDKTVSHKMLAGLLKNVRDLGLHKFEYYLEINEKLAEKQRKLFWKSIYWDVTLGIAYGVSSIFPLDTVTCFLPKVFLDLGVVTIEDLRWFLCNEGYKCIINTEIQEEFEILNIGFSIIVAEFMHKVVHNRKYTGVSLLMKSDQTELDTLNKLMDDLEHYNQFATIFKVIIDNLHRKISNMELPRNIDEKSTKLTYIKFLTNASSFRSFILTSSISLLTRLKTCKSDKSALKRADKMIKLYSELIMTNELTTLKVLLIADDTVFFLKSFDSMSKCLSNTLCMATYFNEAISSEVFINIVRLHKNQRLASDRIINREIYFNQETIHRIPSFINLSCYKLRLFSRIIAQLFMSQRSLNKDKLKEFFRLQLSQYISDSKELADELDCIFDTKLMEHDIFADIQFSMNKKRYETIVNKYKNINKEFSKVVSSKNLKHSALKPMQANLMSNDQIGFGTNNKGVMESQSNPTTKNFMVKDNITNTTPFSSERIGMMNGKDRLPSPKTMFNQSNERNQSLTTTISPFFDDENNNLNINSSITGGSGSISSGYSSGLENDAAVGRNMVERIDFGTMEDFLKNNDNLFANFWQDFNMN
ncbi:hypothetical protein QEN19_003650 [Hanseniaspora menglaensis]